MIFFGNKLCLIFMIVGRYNSYWLKFSTSIRKSLHFIQIKCAAPFEINSFGIINLSMQLYVKVHNTFHQYEEKFLKPITKKI